MLTLGLEEDNTNVPAQAFILGLTHDVDEWRLALESKYRGVESLKRQLGRNNLGDELADHIDLYRQGVRQSADAIQAYLSGYVSSNVETRDGLFCMTRRDDYQYAEFPGELNDLKEAIIKMKMNPDEAYAFLVNYGGVPVWAAKLGDMLQNWAWDRAFGRDMNAEQAVKSLEKNRTLIRNLLKKEETRSTGELFIHILDSYGYPHEYAEEV
jgi:hypothetical protein